MPFSFTYSFRRSATFWGMETISRALPLLGSLRVSFPPLTSSGVSFRTSPDPHAAPGHELQHEPASQFGSLEDDLVHCVLLDGVPTEGWPVPKELLHHGGVAGISDALVDIVPDEVEKGGELIVSDALRLRLCVYLGEG